MKAPLLYLYLFGLIWAQSEHHPQHNKAKCSGEHQIMVKGRNDKHWYYVFQYVYSSLMPSNQTWFKKEEDDNKSIDSGRLWLDKEEGPGKPINYTAEEKEEGSKNVAEIGIKSELEDRRTSEKAQNLNKRHESPSSSDDHQHHGNPSYKDIPQHPSGYILDKGRIDTTDNTAHDIDGSGDLGFLGQDEQHHGTISGNEHQTQGKDHQDNRGTEANNHNLWGRNEAGLLGISKYTKQFKGTHIKIAVKENETSAIQKIILDSYLPKKSKASKSKDYLDVSVKVKNSTSEEPVKEEGGSPDSLDKGNEENASARLQTHFNAQGKISGDLLGNVDRMRNGRNNTTFSNTDEIITVNEKDKYYTEVHKKGGDRYIVLDQKLDGQKVIYGETKPHRKDEVRDLITSSKQIEVVGVMKSSKKDRVKEDVINGRYSSHIEIGGISKIHRTDEGEHMTEITNSQVESPIFTQPSQTNQSQILSHGKLNASKVTKSHTESGGMLERMSVSQRSVSGVINQSQKGNGEVNLIHGKSNKGLEGFHFIKAPQNKAESHEKTNRNVHRGKQGDSERHERSSHRLGVTFQEGNGEVVKRNHGPGKAPGTADLGVDSSGRKGKKCGHKSSPSLAHGSQDYKHIAKSREHSSYTLKDNRKLTEPSKRSSGVHDGRHSSNIAERYRGHLGALQRKHCWHEKKGKSRKDTHASDSSQSSGSEGKSRSDSRQSNEDYQNDNTNSYQSDESVEENLSVGSNQRDDSSQMEGDYSREDSQEPRRH